MKKIILLVGFFLLWVFPPKAWDQSQSPNYANEEYMRQLGQQAIDQKGQMEKKQLQDKTDDLKQKNVKKGVETKDQEAQQKQEGDLENNIHRVN